jgi:YihY family inner membrane protein
MSEADEPAAVTPNRTDAVAVGKRAVVFGRRVAVVVRESDATLLAASVAYYAFLSLLPALLLALAVGSLVAGEQLALAVVGAAGEFLAPTGQQAVGDAFRNAAGRGGATVVGLALLTWSTLKVFRALDIAFSKLYGATGRASVLTQIRDSVVVLGSIGVGAVATVVVGVVTAAVGTEVGYPVLAGVVGVLLLPGLLTVVFLPMYYVFPDADVTVREVWPGAVVAAVGWTLLQAVFQIYSAGASQYEVYGVLGGILLLVTWFYIGALLLFVGVAVNVVRAGRDRQVQLGPDRSTETMSRSGADDGDGDDERPRGAPDVADLDERVAELRADLDDFESDVRERTVEKESLETELKRYVRSRVRRGHARGWGPYLVLLYGTVMTLGAFYFLDGVWAILAMLVLFLSTLGLYTLFVIVGVGLNLLDVPGKAVDAVRDRRE